MIFVGRSGSRVYSMSIVGPMYLLFLVLAVVVTLLMPLCMGGPMPGLHRFLDESMNPPME